MTFDMVMMLMGWPYDSFDCLSFHIYDIWLVGWTRRNIFDVSYKIKLYEFEMDTNFCVDGGGSPVALCGQSYILS